jgi:hypothetical protein
MKSCFNFSRSTEAMVIGSHNEDAVLSTMSKYSRIVKLYSCGLFESNIIPWLAASPDAIAVVTNTQGKSIARKNNLKPILCNYGDEKWTECIGKEHVDCVNGSLEY